MGKNDLEDRLIRFCIVLIKLAERFPKTKVGIHLHDELIRSGTSAPLNYGEAQSAESRKDFIHKMRIVLKKLRESNANLRIVDGVNLVPGEMDLLWLLQEVNELISIFVKSIQTARRNDERLRKIR